MVSGSGPYLTDADGREYVDLVCSWGPMILGHGHPAVVEAVNTAVSQGFSFGTSEDEVALGEEIVTRVEPVEQVRLVSSGTEATMSAIRLARGYTGRSLIVKFAGCYHGHVDSLLAQAGSGVATFALPDSAGVPKEMAAETIVLPFDDLAAVEEAFAARVGDRRPDRPRPRRATWASSPAPGFTEGLHRITADHGALLISDGDDRLPLLCRRVVRHRGPVCRRHADLFTFGKVMGGGFPGRGLRRWADVMALLAPVGPVYQRARCPVPPSPPPPAAPPSRRSAQLYARLDQVADAITGALGAGWAGPGVPPGPAAGSMFSVFFRDGAVGGYDQARDQHVPAYAAFSTRWSARASTCPRTAFESWFVSGAHRRRRRDRIVAALPAAASAAAESFATIGS